MASLRLLGRYERYSLARTNVGISPVPVYVVVLASPIAHKALEVAVNALLARYPLLSCYIPAPRKPFPQWAANPNIKAEDIIEIMRGTPPDLPVLLSSLATMDTATGPLWHVQLYNAEPPTLVLHMHHVISDGVGTRNLLVELLHRVANPNHEDHIDSFPFPPTLEETVDVRPSWIYLLHTLYKAMVLPRLPAALRTWLIPRAVWPNPPRIVSLGRPPRIAVIRVPAARVGAMKDIAKRHNVPTLHPLLLTIALYSVWIAAGHGEVVLSSFSSPVSERNSELGHPTCTGNFVSSYERSVTLSPRQTFWSLARDIAGMLVSPADRAVARGRMGMLAFLPKPDIVNERGQTGWEEFLEHGLVTDTHFNTTISMSNIGLMPLCPGVKEIAWSQRTTPGNGNEPISMNVVTATGGPMYIAVNWLDGVLEVEEMDVFKATNERLISRIVTQGIEDTASFNDLLNSVL